MDVGKCKPSLAIVGTGIGGLASAWLLKDDFDVTVFEKHEQAGMGIFSVEYKNQGISTQIDIPLRVFNTSYYPNLLSLYQHAGVAVEATNHSAAFADPAGKLIYQYGNYKLGAWSFSFPRGRSLLSFQSWKISFSARSFFKKIKIDAYLKSTKDITLGEYLEINTFNADFINIILLPTLSTICTCDYAAVLNYPADLILQCLSCGVMEEGVVRAQKGVGDIVKKLLVDVEMVNSANVIDVVKTEDASQQAGVKITLDNHKVYHFDKVILATQAQQAADIIDDQQTIDWLRAVPVESSTMVIHNDEGVLPQHVLDLSPVSYVVDKKLQRPSASVDLTKAIHQFKTQETVFQTWSHESYPEYPRPESIIAKAEFTRPIVTLESRKAITELSQAQLTPNQSVFLVGSYMANKIPLLDAAVDSALMVARHLGVNIPWECDAESHMETAKKKYLEDAPTQILSES